MANTKIYTGLQVNGEGPIPGIIRSIIADRELKANDEPITLSEIADASSAKHDDIIAALEVLEELKLIQVNGDIKTAGSFFVTRCTFHLTACQMTLPLEKPPTPPDVSSPTKVREETNKDEVKLGETIYLGVLDYNGEQGDPLYHLSASCHPVGKPEEVTQLIEDVSYQAKADAWNHFDNFISRYARTEIGEQLYMDAEGVIWHAKLSDCSDPSEEGKIHLLITSKAPDEDLSTNRFEDVFTLASEAWECVDDYLASPQTEDGESDPQPEPWGDKEPNITGDFEAKIGPVYYELWQNCPDGNDWIRYTCGEQVRHFSIASKDWTSKKPLEEVVISYEQDIDWSAPVEAELS
jgi:hypothetical protein